VLLQQRLRLGGTDHEDALAVVPAARRLENDRPADLGSEAVDLVRRRHAPVAGRRRAELGEPLPHGSLVLGEQQGMRTWPTGVPLGAQRRQVLGRHMLVVEGDDRAVARHSPQVVEVAVIADDRVADDLGSRDVRSFDQHPQGDAERDRGRLHHAGELTTADDCDARSAHCRRRPLVVDAGGRGGACSGILTRRGGRC